MLWDRDAVRDLGSGEARGINNRGDVVGRRYLWRAGREAAPVTTDSHISIFEAQTINDDGLIGGTARSTSSAGQFPALIRENRVELLDDFAGGPGGVVNGVSDRGEVVGMTSMLEGEAFHWKEGKRTLLGTMNGPVQFGFGGHAGYHYSQAFSVNDRGQAVGAANVSERGLNDLHAFLWEGSALTDLNRLVDPAQGWTLREARSINNRGQICGTGERNGAHRAFLLTPVSK
jgi:probable HAF family extracellular repeat protein